MFIVDCLCKLWQFIHSATLAASDCRGNILSLTLWTTWYSVLSYTHCFSIVVSAVDFTVWSDTLVFWFYIISLRNWWCHNASTQVSVEIDQQRHRQNCLHRKLFHCMLVFWLTKELFYHLIVNVNVYLKIHKGANDKFIITTVTWCKE